MKTRDDIMLESYVTEVLDYNTTPNPFEESDKVREIIKNVLYKNNDENRSMIIDLVLKIAKMTKEEVDIEYGKSARSAYSSDNDYDEDFIRSVIKMLGLSGYPKI